MFSNRLLTTKSCSPFEEEQWAPEGEAAPCKLRKVVLLSLFRLNSESETFGSSNAEILDSKCGESSVISGC